MQSTLRIVVVVGLALLAGHADGQSGPGNPMSPDGTATQYPPAQNLVGAEGYPKASAQPPCIVSINSVGMEFQDHENAPVVRIQAGDLKSVATLVRNRSHVIVRAPSGAPAKAMTELAAALRQAVLRVELVPIADEADTGSPPPETPTDPVAADTPADLLPGAAPAVAGSVGLPGAAPVVNNLNGENSMAQPTSRDQLLKKELEHEFEARQVRLRAKLSTFQQRLQEIEETIEARDRLKNEIIQQRIKDLLGQGAHDGGGVEPGPVAPSNAEPGSVFQGDGTRVRPNDGSLSYRLPFTFPTAAAILQAVPEGQARTGDERIHCELVACNVANARFYPLVGPARLSQAHFKCTVISREGAEVVHLDDSKLLPVK